MRHLVLLIILVLALLPRASAAQDTLTLRGVEVRSPRGGPRAPRYFHPDGGSRPARGLVTTIDGSRLRAHHHASPLPMLELLVPGLFTTARSVAGYGVSAGAAGGITLRGLSATSGQMMVLVDGQPQYSGIYGHPVSDTFHTLHASRIEVVSGPASVEYGSGAMGGVINIITSPRGDPREGAWAGQASFAAGSYGTAQADASLSGRMECGLVSGAAHYTRSDNHRPRMGFEQYGAMANATIRPAPSWAVAASAAIDRVDAAQPGTVSSPLYGARQWVTRGDLSATLSHTTPRARGSLHVFANNGRHKIDDGSSSPEQPTEAYFRSSDGVAGASLRQTFTQAGRTSVTMGADWRHTYGRTRYTSKATGATLPRSGRQSRSATQDAFGVMATLSQRVDSGAVLSAGLRYDWHSETGSILIPQCGASLQLTACDALGFNVARGYRNPTMKELFLYAPANEDLHPESVWHYELSWRHATPTLTCRASVFHTRGDNLILTQITPGGPLNTNSGRVSNLGVEVLATLAPGARWTISTSQSLLRQSHKTIGAPVWQGTALASYTAGRWSVESALRVFAGLLTSADSGSPRQSAVLVTATVTYSPTPRVSLWTRGDNLLATRYETTEGYPMPRATFLSGCTLTL